MAPRTLLDPKTLGALPAAPGVYIMRDAEGAVLYVGKATNLRSRVRSYFNKSGDTRFSVQFLRRLVAQVECVVTASEKEAFLLENTLIKEHKPRYNIRLRDDKTYVSLRLRMNHDFPRLEIVRVRRHIRPRGGSPADIYFGPYTSSGAVHETLKFLLKVFPVRTCKDSVFANRTRPCLLYDVGKCCGPCVLPVPKEDYARLVEQVTLFLRGRSDEVRRLLAQRMQEFAEAMEYERAALVRDRIAALDATLERQQVANHAFADRDVIAVASERGRSAIALLPWRNGLLGQAAEFYVRNYEQTDGEVLYSFLSQHYETAEPPPEIHLSVEPQDAALLAEWLRDRRGSTVNLRVPQRGDAARLMVTALANARQILERRLAGEKTDEEVLAETARRLGLPAPPSTIECVDISNIMGRLAVGAIVRFEGTKPNKAGYRLYKIRTVDGSNDFAMMREVLTRRFRPSDGRPAPPPDLLLIDGGKGQLSAALDVARQLGLDRPPMAAIAKSRVGDRTMRSPAGRERHAAGERIFLPGQKNPVNLAPNSPVLYLLQRVRDEAHRFAITYHKRLRAKSGRRSLLDEVPGVGPARRRLLLRHFGSLAAVRSASLEQLAAVRGIGLAAAQAIYAFLHPPADDKS
ncbi:MAG: excinuclease ABC subunit UvrC [Candidatus Sumerlaeaceae bacterium]|nr:excinuclease ABC subunit UvrC [Candidatus Sumerlaeaceae bacterium]